jgi:hypothetical protein
MNIMNAKLEIRPPLHAASELTAAERAVVEKFAGRPLGDSEVFVISTYRVHPAPAGEAREEAANELREAMNVIGRKLKDVPPKEIEQQLDNTLRDVRPGYRRVAE